jgi:hypothetical protein
MRGRFCEKLKCDFNSLHLLFKFLLPRIAKADKTIPYKHISLRLYMKHNHNVLHASLLGYDALVIGEWLPKFWRSMLPPPSEYQEYSAVEKLIYRCAPVSMVNTF